MAHFAYTAVSRKSGVRQGVIEAETLERATLSLEEQGFQIIRLEHSFRDGFRAGQKRRLLRWFFERPVTRRDHIQLLKAFKRLFSSGVPMTRLLETLQKETEHRELSDCIADIGQRVAAGSTLHQAFAAHPAVFSPLDCAMTHAGEFSGALGESLDRLVLICEHENRIRREISAALRYPKMVVAALIVSFFVLLHWIVPSFAMVFQNAQHALPMPTRIAIWLNESIRTDWGVLLGMGVGVWAGMAWISRLPRYVFLRDRLLLMLPGVGEVLLKSLLSRFAFLFSMLQHSGVGILESMDILAATINNAVLARECLRIKAAVQAGQGLAQSFADSGFFPPFAVTMIAVGEDAGEMEEALRDLAVCYDEDVSDAASVITESVGPALTLVLAGMVGFFALAVLLPMWNMVGLSR